MPADGQPADPATGNPGDIDGVVNGIVTLGSGVYRRTSNLNIGSGAGALSSLDIKGNVTLVLYNPSYGLINSQYYAATSSPAINIGGSTGAINIDATAGRLTVYTSGNVDIGGKGAVFASGKCELFTIFANNYTNVGSSGAQYVKLAGNAQNSATVWGPNATVFMAGGGSNGVINGAVIAYNITANGSVDLHYDERLSMAQVNIPQLEYWVELKGSAKRDLSPYFPGP